MIYSTVTGSKIWRGLKLDVQAIEARSDKTEGLESSMTEWRRIPISPYRSYEVSDVGDIRRGSRVLRGYVDRYGYRTVLLYYAGLGKRFKVHRLVCEAFHGPAPEGTECAHLDGDKQNERVDNLAWVTRTENMRHNALHGKAGRGGPKGEGHPDAKLTANDVLQMRELFAAGMSGRALARKFGIGSAQASAIIRGAAWKSVAKPCTQGTNP